MESFKNSIVNYFLGTFTKKFIKNLKTYFWLKICYTFTNMYSISLKSILLFGILVLTNFVFAQDEAFKIQIDNVENNIGEIEIGVWRAIDTFPFKKRIFKKYRFKAQAETGIYELKDLPKGEYAFALFHDQNNDNVCDTNFIGYPTEGHCISNNFIVTFYPPSFKVAKVNTAENPKIVLKMIY